MTFYSKRNTESGLATSQIIIGAVIVSVLWSATVLITDYVEQDMDSRGKKKAVDADEKVVEREMDGSYTITFHTG